MMTSLQSSLPFEDSHRRLQEAFHTVLHFAAVTIIRNDTKLGSNPLNLALPSKVISPIFSVNIVKPRFGDDIHKPIYSVSSASLSKMSPPTFAPNRFVLLSSPFDTMSVRYK